jgi:phosphoglycerate dehydrogenase-like enzyme
MKILIASSIDPTAQATLERAHDVTYALDAPQDVLREAVHDREILIFRSSVDVTANVMAGAPRLKLLIRAGSGMDNVDLDYARRHGIRFERIPGPAAQAVAELTFGLMLALARRIVEADRLLRQGHWPKRELAGHLLRGKTLGIVGAGNIGSRVGQMGAAWGMRPLGCIEPPLPPLLDELEAQGIRPASFDQVVAQADFLTLHVPLLPGTQHLIDADVLARVKPGAFLINTARGGVVDEAALYQALTEGGRLAGAALDVHEQEGEGHASPLADLPNVVLTPHIGSMARDTQREIGQRILELVRGVKSDA